MADVTKTIKMLIIGDATGANKSFQSVGRNMLQSVKHADTVGKKAKIAGLALGGIMASGALAAAAALVKFGGESVDTFKRVGTETIKLGRLTGMSAEDASRLGFAFKMTGIDAATGARSMGLFEKNTVKMAEADKNAKIKAQQHADTIRGQIKALEAAGPSSAGYADKMSYLKGKLADATTASKMNASALGSLGIKYTDAKGKMLPMADLLPKVAEKFKEMPDGAEKSALAMKLFGKSGAALLPFLNKGAEGLKELGIQSDKTGNTLNGKQLEAIKANKKAQREWDAAMQGLQVTLGSSLLPILTQGAEFLNSVFVPAIQGVTQFVKDNQGAFDGLGNMMRGFWNSILLPVIKFWVSGNAETAKGIGIIIEATGRLTGNKDMEKFGQGIQNAATATKDWVNSLQDIPPVVTPVVDVATDKARANVAAIDNKIKGLKGKIVTATAKGDGKQVDALKRKLEALQRQKFHAQISSAVTMDKAHDQIVYKIIGSGTMKFTARRRGGPIKAGQPYWVGEDGPEPFFPSVSGHMLSNPQARTLASAGAGSMGGGSTVVQITVQGDSDPLGAARRIQEKLNALSRAQGGKGFKV